MSHRFSFRIVAFLMAAAGLASTGASADPDGRPAMEVLVGGTRLPTYAARGTLYVEALKGREYEIRLRNPYPVRVAVALSVDGLNTIDARRTTAAEARKWVIEPYGTVTIGGWQTSLSHARRFEFTTEERSYGAWLGKTNDLGIISAVFFRERPAGHVVPITPDAAQRNEPASDRKDPGTRPAGEAGTPPPAAGGAARAQAVGAEEYAATGIGRRTDHAVRQVHLDLESTPAASVSIRYEFRDQLVRLRVLPPSTAQADPLDRRERARGFDRFCPEPKR
jgi:hypothetical protein